MERHKDFLLVDKSTKEQIQPEIILKFIYSPEGEAILKKLHRLITCMFLLKSDSYTNAYLQNEIDKYLGSDELNSKSFNARQSKYLRVFFDTETDSFNKGFKSIEDRCFRNLSRGEWCLTDFSISQVDSYLEKLNIDVYYKF